jgi:bifunctional non-homologous end joining protein LigD
VLPKIDTMELIQQSTPFDHPDWIFELKYDGFRSLAYIKNGTCKLVSRNEYNYRRFTDLRDTLPTQIHAKDAVLDGELVVLDEIGKPRFHDLMVNRGTVVFAAFDLMWLDGQDMRDRPLLMRKEVLRNRMKDDASRAIFVDHIVGRGKALYKQICEMDLEGIVCKPSLSPYRTVGGTTTWIKIKNPNYSQKEGRGELFNGRGS